MSSANTERSPADRSNALAKSITGAATLISANAFARILTFVLNQILVMYFTTPAVLGTVHVQLELLLSTILFVGREPARMTVLRGRIATGPKDDRTRVSSSARTFLQSLVNLSYISILIGTCLTAVATALLGPNGSDRAANSPYLLYAAASVIELLSEPLYLVAQHRLMLSQRARVEAFAATAKTGAIVLAMGYHSYLVFSEGTQSTGLVSESQAIFSFAIGQLAYGVAIFLGWTYEWFMEFKRLSKAAGAAKKREGATMTRSKAAELASDEDNILYSAGFSLFLPTWVNNSAVTGWWFGFAMYPSYFFQSLVKFLLNEGDRILLNWLATAQQQGVWAFVFNYGSLIVRIVFLPIEDSLRAYMSKTSGDSTADRKALGAVLSTVLHLYVTYLALPMWFLAPAYATSLISLIGGQTWLQSGAPLALAFYCRFLPFLASNGVLEAFVQTVADPKTMSSYSTSLVFFWLAFAATAWTFMGGVFDWGATGMICAALINVALRLSWGAKHAGRYFAGAAGGFSLTSLFSNDPAVWIAWTVAWFTSSQAVPRITAVDMAQRRTDVACLGVGGLLGLCCILFTAYRERQFWRSLRELRQK